MIDGARKAGLRRFLSAALSLALIVASVLGVRSHAGHNEHHHRTASTIDVLIAHPAKLAAELVPDLTTEQVSAADVEHGDTTRHDHGTCNDMVCHGGFAVLAAISTLVHFELQPMRWLWSDQSGGRASSLTLDRPPKALVFA